MKFFFFELIKTVMEINSLAGYFFWNYRFRFFLCGGSHVESSLFAQIWAFVLHMSTCLDSRREATTSTSSCSSSSISSPGTSSRCPLQKTLWTGPWQMRQTTRTTRPCQTRRLSRSCLTCRQLRRLGPQKKNCHLHHITSSLCCLTCPLSRVSCSLLSHVSVVLCVFFVCSSQAPQ